MKRERKKVENCQISSGIMNTTVTSHPDSLQNNCTEPNMNYSEQR